MTKDETPFLVVCTEHGKQYLSELSYKCQCNDMTDGDWHCPRCWKAAEFDYDWFYANITNYKWKENPLPHHILQKD